MRALGLEYLLSCFWLIVTTKHKEGRLDFTSRVIGGCENKIGLIFSQNLFFPFVNPFNILFYSHFLSRVLWKKLLCKRVLFKGVGMGQSRLLVFVEMKKVWNFPEIIFFFLFKLYKPYILSYYHFLTIVPWKKNLCATRLQDSQFMM